MAHRNAKSNIVKLEYARLCELYDNDEDIAQIYALNIFPPIYPILHVHEFKSEAERFAYAKALIERETGKFLQTSFYQFVLEAELSTHLGYKRYLHSKNITNEEEAFLVDSEENVTDRELTEKQDYVDFELGQDECTSQIVVTSNAETNTFELKEIKVLRSEVVGKKSRTKRKSSDNLKHVKNHRNGFYVRELITNLGVINIEMPRDRFGSFDSALIPKGTKSVTNSSDLIFFFVVGENEKELITVLKTMSVNKSFPNSYYESTVKHFLNSPFLKRKDSLPNFVPYIFAYSLVISLTRNGHPESYHAHIVLSYDEKGKTRLLDLQVFDHESDQTWHIVFEELFTRGLQKVVSFSVVQRNFVENAIYNTYKSAKIYNFIEQQVHPRKLKSSEYTELIADTVRDIYAVNRK